jgi:hypothetical protein
MISIIIIYILQYSSFIWNEKLQKSLEYSKYRKVIIKMGCVHDLGFFLE